MSITLIIGEMFSGKSTELLRRVDRARYAGQNTILYKYAKDVRFGDERASMISSHGGIHKNATPITSLKDVPIVPNSVIFLDEGQFIDYLVEFAEEAANKGCTVVVAALSSDFNRNAFARIAELQPKCEEIIRLRAICFDCKKDAGFTKRLTTSMDLEVIGGAEAYKPVCRECYFK
jgi:thymidine kinase